MRKALIFIVVAIALACAVFSVSSEDFLNANFHYNEISFNQIFMKIVSFFKGGITGLMGYSGTSNANLTVWDDTDSSTKYIDEQIYFFANFTNSTTVLDDTLANVSICINFTTPICENMSFNSTSKLWQFNLSPFFYGTFNWSVNATSIVENLAANDTVTIVNRCLNVSKLTEDYYIKTSRTICSGNHSTNYSIVFYNVSSIELNCNNAVLRGGFPSENPQPLIFIENGSNLYIHDCIFFNSSGNDIRANSSIYLNIENILSNFNNATDSTLIFINSNFTTINNVRIYNSKAVFGLGLGDIYSDKKVLNNSITNLYVENVSSPLFGNLSTNFSSNLSLVEQLTGGLKAIGFGVINQIDLRASDINIKNIEGVCAGQVDSNRSIYTDMTLHSCSNIGFVDGSMRDNSPKKITFENASIYDSGFAIALASILTNVSGDASSSIKNINIYNSTYVLAAAFENLNSSYIFSNIKAYDSSTAFFGQGAKANLRDSYLEITQPVKLQNSTVSFLNVTFDKSAPSSFDDNSLFIVKWLFSVLAIDNLLEPVQNANVTLYNSSGVVFSELTNSSGLTGWKELTEFEEDLLGKNYQQYTNLTVLSPEYLPSIFYPVINESQRYTALLLGNYSIVVFSPVNGSYYNSHTINLTYVVLFYNDTDSCWFINTTGKRINLTNCTNTTFTALEGLNNISVFANSTKGNTTFSKIFFIVDTVKPNITFFNISLETNTSVVIRWNASEDVNMSFIYGKTSSLSDGSGYNSTFSSQNSYLLSGLEVHKVYSINTTFCDRAANCVLNSTMFSSGAGNFTPTNLHIPEAEIIVQELVASELTATPQKTTLTPGSKYIFTVDSERHYIKLKLVYGEEKAVFEFGSEPFEKEILKGETAEVDIDGDGINDIAVTISDIELTKVTFELKRISFKEAAQPETLETTPPKEETPALVAQPSAPLEQPREKTFMEKYSLYIIISLVALVAAISGAGAWMLQKRKSVVIAVEKAKQALPVPKASHLENIMKEIYKMLKEGKTELDVTKYLEELNLEENVIKSIIFEMRTRNNRMDQLISFTKKAFSQGKSVEEVREILEKNGWAKNIIVLATEE